MFEAGTLAVAGELHGERALALRLAAQVGRVAERFWPAAPRRRWCADLRLAGLGRHDQAAAANHTRQSPDPGTARPGTSISIFITGSSRAGFVFRKVSREAVRGHRSGRPCPSCRPRGTNRLRELHLTPMIGKPATGPLLQGVAETLLVPRECIPWECVRRSRCSLRRSKASSLNRRAAAPACRRYGRIVPNRRFASCACSCTRQLCWALAVADLRRTNFDLDTVFAANTLDVDLEVQFAHAGDQRFGRSPRRSSRWKVGSSLRNRASALPILVAASARTWRD